MPHQCLKCGRVFKEGSSQLLKGCPDCGGNRFFYTKKPLDEEERTSKMEEADEKLNSAIMDLMNEDKKDIDTSGDWVNIRPDDIREAIKQKEKPSDKKEEQEKHVLKSYIDDKTREKIINKIKSELENPHTPETIDIEKPGNYNIDVKGLLEEEPIVIQKDGSYNIHLPSVFKAANKGKKK